MNCASLCVGIIDYAHPIYGASVTRLRHAVSDALAFSNYLRGAFPEVGVGESLHRTLMDSEGLASRIEEEINDIGARADLQVFVLYLAGHGEQGQGQGGWFCLHDAQPSSPSLDGQALQRLLTSVRARHVLVVVDCCHAEALIRGTSYFAALGEQASRRFIASARVDQRAWEDIGLGRSVLSDVLLRACSAGSSLQGPEGRVRVEGSLFGHLREQVPMQAWALKHGQVQEPVTGGVALSELELPTVSARAFGRPLTIVQTLRRRLRQILLRTAVATASLLVLTELLAYHVMADSNGRILVLSGLPATHTLMPFALFAEVDTGWRIGDLAADDGAGLDAIGQGRVRGMQLHLDPSGLRPWFGSVSTHLDADMRSRQRALAVGQLLPRLDEGAPPPLDETVFLSRLNGRPTSELLGAFYSAPTWTGRSCDATARQALDFTILQVPDRVYALDLLWESLGALGPQPRASAIALAQITRTGYRALHRNTGDVTAASVAELRHLAYSLAVMRAATVDGAWLEARLTELLATPCRAAAAVGVALLGSTELRTRAEELLLTDLEAPDVDLHRSLPPHRRELAAAALMLIAAAGPLRETTVKSLAEILQRDDPHLEQHTPVRQLLLRVALVQPLPPGLISRLLVLLHTPEESGGFASLEALLLLSHNVRFLAPAPRKDVIDWLNSNVSRLRRMSIAHEAIGLIEAAGWGSGPSTIGLLGERLPAKTHFSLPSNSYRGEMIITPADEPAAVALGRIAGSTVLPDELIERLARFAMGRPNVENRILIVGGLASQWYRGSMESAQLLDRLRRAASDSGRRRLESEVACVRLMRLPPSEHTLAVNSLVTTWREESEPEIRIALALIIAQSWLPELDGMTRCGAD